MAEGTANNPSDTYVKPIPLSNENLNDLIPDNTTWYYAGGGNSVSNTPRAGSAFGLMICRIANGFRLQIYFTADLPSQLYIRMYTGTWSNWGYINITTS